MPTFVAARFGVWAKRSILGVGSEGALGVYDQWLLSYANAWIDGAVSQILPSLPGEFGKDVLTSLRNRLGQQVQYWQAEARRYLAEQQAFLRAQTATPDKAARESEESGEGSERLTVRGWGSILDEQEAPKTPNPQPLPRELEVAVATRSKEELKNHRAKLLADYKSSTDNPSNRQIYQALNSGIHKPEFLEWLRGELSTNSKTTQKFERFLREKKPPIPRHPRD